MLTEECKKEIEVYVVSMGYSPDHGVPLFKTNNKLTRTYFAYSKEDKKRNLSKYIGRNNHVNFDKYLLEFIGHILRKHKIYNFEMVGIPGYVYISNTWRYEDIVKL